METQPTPQKGAQRPKFSAHIYCSQTAGWIKIALGMEVGVSTDDFVLDGTPLPLPKKGAVLPKFSADVYYGQTAGWIKMVVGMEVGVSPGDFVFDEDPARLSKKGAEPHSPIFGPFLLWPNG